MDKRRFTRFPLTTKAKVLVTSKNILLEGEAENLSLKGLFIETSTVLPLNEHVEVEICIPEDPSRLNIKTPAIVVRHQDAGMGLEFAGMDFDCFFALKDMISRISGSPGLVAREFFDFINNEP